MACTVYRLSSVAGIYAHVFQVENLAQSSIACRGQPPNQRAAGRVLPQALVILRRIAAKYETRHSSDAYCIFRFSATREFRSLCFIPANLHHTTCGHDYQRARLPTTLPVDSLGLLQHFTNEGWLTPVVNRTAMVQGADSPEARAFVVLMQAAYRDWAAMDASQTTGGSKNIVRTSNNDGWLRYLMSTGAV